MDNQKNILLILHHFINKSTTNWFAIFMTVTETFNLKNIYSARHSKHQKRPIHLKPHFSYILYPEILDAVSITSFTPIVLAL